MKKYRKQEKQKFDITENGTSIQEEHSHLYD